MTIIHKTVRNICNEIGANMIDSTRIKYGNRVVSVRDNNGIYDISSYNIDNLSKPRTKKGVFATDLRDTLHSFLKGVNNE